MRLPTLLAGRRAGALLVLLVPLSPEPARAQGRPPTPVRVDAARLETVRERRLVTGDLRAAQRSLVASEEEGVLVELARREGERIAAGEPLARLDGARIELELARLEAEALEARATVAEREAEAAQARRDYEALQELARADAARPKELADGESAWRIAEARVEASKRAIEVIEARGALARQRLEDTVVRAPFDGVVVRLHSEVGQWVGRGSALLELVSDARLEAWLDVPQRDYAGLVAAGGALQLRIDATGEALRVEDYRVVAAIDPRARTFAVVAPLPAAPADGAASASRTVVAGMSVSAWVPKGTEAERLTVSHDAVLRNEVGSFVYVAAGGGEGAPATAGAVPVEVLFETEGRVVVRSERLAPGDLAVVEGNERLFPGAPVIPSPAGGAAGGGGEGGGRGGSGAAPAPAKEGAAPAREGAAPAREGAAPAKDGTARRKDGAAPGADDGASQR